MNTEGLNFASANVKGIKTTEKRIKLFKYYFEPDTFILLNETH